MSLTRITLFQGIALAWIALSAPVSQAQFIATTTSIGETSAGLGAAGTTNPGSNGPLPSATSVSVSSSWPVGSGNSAASSLQASANFGALRAHGSARATGLSARSSAGSIFADDDPLTAALFEDQITIGGVGTQTFQLHFALSGMAGKTGPGQMLFAADLSVQAWGSNVTVIAGPTPIGSSIFGGPDTYGFSVKGTAPRTIGLSDSLLMSALGGSTMNLSGYLGAYIRVSNSEADGETLGTLNLSNTGSFFIVPVSGGGSFTSASGHDYLAAPVPEVGTAALMLGALPLLGWFAWRRRMSS